MGTGLAAIYIPTKGRPEHLGRLLESITSLDTPIHLLLSDLSDVDRALLPANVHVHLRSLFGFEFDCLLNKMRSRSHPVFSIPDTKWDLPLKRNYALWHAATMNYSRILLLDDDIRGLNGAKIGAIGEALQTITLAGFIVADYPDTSVMGHLEIELGHAVPTFMSGSCLGINATASLSLFPSVYNEDWLFMAPLIAMKQVCSLGTIVQVEYDPLITPDKAIFQEPGEILGDGTFALLASRSFDRRFDHGTWERLLQLRHEWLSNLKQETKNPEHIETIDAAMDLLTTITPEHCVQFWLDWEMDCLTWSNELRRIREGAERSAD